MNLIKFNNVTVANPSTYEVEYSDVNGEKSQVEDGTTYIEQIRGNVPTIKVGWTNLRQSELNLILDELTEATVSVTYYFNREYNADMMISSRSLKLKHIDEAGNYYWDLSFTLEG